MLGDLLRELLGIGGGAAKPATRTAKKAGSGAARAKRFAGTQQKARPMTPSQRDYPGRTNYGTPQDNMIDTPGGYVTPEQYDRGLLFGGYPRSSRRMPEDAGFVGNPRSLNQYSPLNMDVKNFSGAADFGRTNPMQAFGARTANPMGFDSIPNNYTAGRTGYYQGSNPYLNNIDDLDYKLRVR